MYTKQEEKVNLLTGEVACEQTKVQIIKIKVRYVMSLKSNQPLKSWKIGFSGREIELTEMLCYDADEETHTTNLRGLFQKYSIILDCKQGSITDMITKLIKACVLCRIDKDNVMVNPNLLFKGSLKDLKKQQEAFKECLKVQREKPVKPKKNKVVNNDDGNQPPSLPLDGV
jgi:hypothetical protein